MVAFRCKAGAPTSTEEASRQDRKDALLLLLLAGRNPLVSKLTLQNRRLSGWNAPRYAFARHSGSPSGRPLVRAASLQSRNADLGSLRE